MTLGFTSDEIIERRFIMTLEERIKALEDIELIKKLHITYVNKLIETDWDGVLDCFTEDCVLDLNSGRAEGKETVSQHFRKY